MASAGTIARRDPGACAKAGKPPDITSGAAALQEDADEQLHTAYVEEMLATDPVVALGLRVVGAPPLQLQYVSVDEARGDLRALLSLLVARLCDLFPCSRALLSMWPVS